MYVIKAIGIDGKTAYWTPEDWVYKQYQASRFLSAEEARVMADYWRCNEAKVVRLKSRKS
jgi:hypothetical protein